MKIGELSGGQRSKVSLAKLLVSDSNLLLLDEPTNHLDVEAINWLENFLGEYKGAYIVISHDRYFLDKVTNMTMELEHQTLTQYNGNYSKYLDEKERRRQEAEHRYESQMHEINRIEGIIEQQRRWNREKNIRTAESKQKMVDRLKEQLEKPEKEERGIRFEFGVNTRGGNDVLFCDRLSKSFDEKQLFKNVNIHIQNGERVFLLGANGCGKTTLFKIIDGDIFADSGKVTLGSRIETGYYDQTQANLNPAKTALDEVWDSYRDMTETAVRNALAAFLFRGDDVYKKIAGLSGGERARIALLKLMLSRANFLLLDEPTNHLDIKSREALEAALESYRGTLFIISHDRYFINKTADRILYLDSTGITEFKGGYSYYLEHLERLNHDSVEKKPEKPVVNEFKLKKERQSEIRRTRTAVSKCESRISELDGEVEELERRLQIPEIMSDYAKILELTGRLDELKNEQTQVLEDWEKLSERLVELEAAEV